MPRIFDNIEHKLLDALQETLKVAECADFCVGYFNLRGWRHIDRLMGLWSGGEQACCRLMIGMQERPEDELRKVFSLRSDQGIDQATVVRLKKRVAQDFRAQLLVGAPSNEDEQGLRRLSAQLRAGRLVVKLYLRHRLHAKLYLLYNPHHPYAKAVGYLGSSNLTLSGLAYQGELNVDVVDDDACRKLEQWFNDRWHDRWCLDISQELADIIDESWAREEMLSPYHIYLKIAYHLSEQARTGLSDFRIPRVFQERLFDYQAAAVKIAAHHLNKRGGVIIGDVVGLGKTLMATTLARIMQDDYDLETLIICPKNLVSMWDTYLQEYGIVGRVCSLSNVLGELPNLRRYRLVVIDESHNLRNREGKRYRIIKEYIEKNESRCVLLTATPYNKTFLDISAQLRLFLSDDASKDLGIRPEKLLSVEALAKATEEQILLLRGLSGGGKRLMGFCRTNLFEGLESGGSAFLQSITRQSVRNYVFLHAIEHGLELPIGTQSAELLDTQSNDEDDGIVLPGTLDEDDASTEGMTIVDETHTVAEQTSVYSEGFFKKQAAEVYQQYSTQFRKRFKWIKPTLFNASLKKDLRQDTQKLLNLLKQVQVWQAQHDQKLRALIDLITQRHPDEKVLIFTQFADTVRYLAEQLKAHGIPASEGVTGTSENPTAYAWRFSPLSNNRRNQITSEQ